jgi:hypothetical protein
MIHGIANLAGTIPVEQSFMGCGHEFNILRFGFAGSTGESTENAGGFDANHGDALKAAVSLEECIIKRISI